MLNVQNLVNHMHEMHPLEIYELNIECHYCEEKFKTKKELMIHRKLTHSEKVQFCAHFSEGKCDFKDSCWFSHDISKRKDLPEYKCNVCEKVFRIQSAFMKHRRKEHNRHVPICRDSKNGCCQYGIENCWFMVST